MQEKPPLPPIEGKAGEMLSALMDFVDQSMTTPRLLLGTVVSSATGPPATITATVHGQTIPAIRYIGSAPATGKIAVILADGPFYVCLGVLT